MVATVAHIPPNQPTGSRAFFIVWSGQVVSFFGSALTAFALTIWAWLATGEVTALALAALFNFAPGIFLSPVAGALVDRWNRKYVMMLTDLGSGIATIWLFAIYSTGNMQLWHIYVAGGVSSAFAAFQFPAYSAAVTMLLNRKNYARASGMFAMGESAAQIFAPAVAGALIPFIGIGGILMIDIATFSFSILAISTVFIPAPKRTEEGQQGKGNLLGEAAYGFRYIVARPSLLGLQLMFFFANLFGGFAIILLDPMILARTAGDQIMLGTVRSMMALGGLAGGMMMSLWGGPKRRVHGVLLGMFCAAMLGQIPLGIAQSVQWWMVSAFLMFFCINILNASNQAIWQAKVAPDVQGRVFAARRLIAQITIPAVMIAAGPLADRLFEPGMAYQGALSVLSGAPLLSMFESLIRPDTFIAGIFGGMVGYGAGAGIATMLVISGMLAALAALSGYLFPSIRNAEDILPDYDTSGDLPPIDSSPTGGAVVTDEPPALGNAPAPA